MHEHRVSLNITILSLHSRGSFLHSHTINITTLQEHNNTCSTSDKVFNHNHDQAYRHRTLSSHTSSVTQAATITQTSISTLKSIKMPSHLRIQSSLEEPISANAIYLTSPSLPPAKKQKMSLTQTYYVASTARSKLGREASKADHDLRRLVGSAST